MKRMKKKTKRRVESLHILHVLFFIYIRRDVNDEKGMEKSIEN